MQKEGWNGLTGLERGKPCKNLGGKQQKIDEWACPSWRDKEKFEKLLKSEFEQVKLILKKKKIDSRFSIDWNFRFDWSK